MIRKNFLKIIFIIVIIMIFTAGVSCDKTENNGSLDGGTITTEPPESAVFDSENVVFKYGVMTDIHINMGEGASSKFKNAIDYLLEVTDNKIDALTFAGDLTDHATADEAKEFKRVLEESLPSEIPMFYALGNHDDGLSPKKFAETFGEEHFKNDVAEDKINRGHRHAVINGYHFITVKPSGYWANKDGSKQTIFIKSTLTWLTETLDAIVAEEPDKPIIVISHGPVAETAIGSYLPELSSFDLKEVLVNYPQVIYHSGHVHNPLQNETAIMQKEFTVIDAGAITYAGKDEAIEYNAFPYVVQDNLKDYDRGNYAMGHLIEIDKNNAVRVTRLDFFNREINPIKWYIPPVKADGSHLNAYTVARYDEDPAPYFTEDAEIKWTKSGTELVILFDAAKDESFVHHYKAEVYDIADDKIVAKANLESGFFRFTDMSKMQETYSYRFKRLEDGKKYEIRIYAYDSWYKTGEPLKMEITFEEQGN